MKRGTFDVLRRGVDNTVANWPLILIRVAEMVVLGMLAIATLFIALVPILVSFGIEVSKIGSIEDIEQAMLALMQQWILLVWVFVAILVLITIFVAIHSVVEAGSARVYVDAERAAGPTLEGPRSRYRVFTIDRWMAGAREGWWTVFWIYNFAWGAAGLILLIPLIPTAIASLMLREKPIAIAISCLGLVLTVLLLIVVGIVTGMWVNRAINEWAVHRSSARVALSSAWSALHLDLARHLLILIAIMVVSMAGSSFFASFSLFASMGEGFGNHGMFSFITMPIRLLGTLLSTVFSAIVSAWYLASYAGLAAE
ncbi:MAG TPA: hypothetical protein VGQ76_19580 [Thermoanaerobaculia bacterium]|nr:hypothetical protein [Thermoanaerobaculia bacterium]